MALWDPRKKSSRRLFSTRHVAHRQAVKASVREAKFTLLMLAIVFPIAWWIHGPPTFVSSDGTTWPERDDAAEVVEPELGNATTDTPCTPSDASGAVAATQPAAVEGTPARDGSTGDAPCTPSP